MRTAWTAAALAAAALVHAAAPPRAEAGRGRATKPPPEPPPEIEFEVEPDPDRASAEPPADPPQAAADEATGGLREGAAASPAPRARRFYFRGGVTLVRPLASSRELELADVGGPASLAVQNGPIAGSGSEVGSATIPAVVIGYTLPSFGGRVSLETVLGVPFTVKFKATGTLANQSIAPMALGIPTGVPALGSELGEAKAIPPLVTLVYRLPEVARVVPFVGAGGSVLFAYDARVTNPVLTAVSQPDFTIAPAPGLVVQGGAEVHLARRLHARLDVKYIAGMLARAEVQHIQVKTPDLPLFDTVEVGTAKMSVWVNPLIVSLGVGLDL